jgi:hypothetical protein
MQNCVAKCLVSSGPTSGAGGTGGAGGMVMAGGGT